MAKGYLDTKSHRANVIIGNLALSEFQGITAGFLSAFFSIILSCLLFEKEFLNSKSIALVFSTSLLASTLTCLFINLIMCSLAICCRSYKINYENIATPITIVFGDICTIGLLSFFSTFLNSMDSEFFCWNIVLCFAILLVVCLNASKENEHVSSILYDGWIPLLTSLVICSFAGLILESYIGKYNILALLSHVLNGLTSSATAIYSNRLITKLQLQKKENNFKSWFTLFLSFSLVQIAFVHFSSTSNSDLGTSFWMFYLFSSSLILFALFKFSEWMVFMIIRIGQNPENCVMPIVTSVGDILGVGICVLNCILLDLKQ